MPNHPMSMQACEWEGPGFPPGQNPEKDYWGWDPHSGFIHYDSRMHRWMASTVGEEPYWLDALNPRPTPEAQRERWARHSKGFALG